MVKVTDEADFRELLVKESTKKRKLAVNLRGKCHGKEIEDEEMVQGGGIISINNSKEELSNTRAFKFNTVDDIKEILSDLEGFSGRLEPNSKLPVPPYFDQNRISVKTKSQPGIG